MHQAISAMAMPGSGVVVRAVPQGAGPLVTLLASGAVLEPDELADLAGQLATVDGTVATHRRVLQPGISSQEDA